jgi:hypothetical protein
MTTSTPLQYEIPNINQNKIIILDSMRKSVYEKCMELGVDEFQGFYFGKPMEKFLPDNLNYVDLYSRGDNVSSVKTSKKSDEALTNSSVLRAGDISNFI